MVQPQPQWHQAMALNRPNNRPAALPAPQVHPVNLDIPVVPEMLVLQEPPVTPVNQLLLLVKQPLLHHAIHAQLDQPDLLDHLDHLVMPEPLDNPVDPEMTVNLVKLDPRVLLDLLDRLEILEPLVNLVNLDHRAHLNLDHLDQPVMLEPLDPLANLVNLDKTADLAQLDQRAHPDHLANPDPMDILDNPVRLVKLAGRARRASAPSTAPSMVECSSRTELDVVKREIRGNGEEPEGDSICQGLLNHCHTLAIGLLAGALFTGKLQVEMLQ